MVINDEVRHKFRVLAFFNKAKGIMDWENIKEGNKYHIPPIAGSKRKNILVTYKDSYKLKYVELNSDTVYSALMYKSDPCTKFLSLIR
jgi:hypothetical protein